MNEVKAVLAVKFQSSHDQETLMEVCQNGLGVFRSVPGLVQKYYIVEEDTGALSGIYLFESTAARETFWNSDLAKTIPSEYGVIPESIRVEKYEMAIVLNEEAVLV
ncbi:MAG: YdhR family protein [Bacteroidota bacterium]